MKLNNTNTMEKIGILLEQLENKVTPNLAKRLDSYEALNEELDTIGQEYESNPSDENRTKYNEKNEALEQVELGIVKDLEALLEKRKADKLAKEQKENEPAPVPAPKPSDNPTTETKEEKEEKKGGIGVLTLIVGGVFLFASFGAINFLKKR